MKLAIIPIIVGAFKFCWLHRHQFYYLALPVVTILAIFSTLLTTLSPDNSLQALEFKFLGEHTFNLNETIIYSYNSYPGYFFADLSLFFLIVFFFPLYSVAWHRFYLVPEENLNVLACYYWKKRHSLFLWSNLKIFLLMVPIGGISILITIASVIFAPLVGVAMIFFVAMCYARFSMWLPATALDKQMNFHEAFVLTYGNGARLALILILTGILAGILDGIATSLIAHASNSLSAVGSLTQTLLKNFALYLIMYAGMAIGITALSISYQQLAEFYNPSETS